MKLTTRGRFAVTSMIDLSMYEEKGPVRLCDIARREQISIAYLEQLFLKLRRANLVKSSRGPGGGYRLARGASEITAGEIVAAVEDENDEKFCYGTGQCRRGAECLARGLWTDLNHQVTSFLNSQTLTSIREKYASAHREGLMQESVIVFKNKL